MMGLTRESELMKRNRMSFRQESMKQSELGTTHEERPTSRTEEEEECGPVAERCFTAGPMSGQVPKQDLSMIRVPPPCGLARRNDFSDRG